MVAYNIPADYINAAQAGAWAAFRQSSTMRATNTGVLAVARGTIDNPKLKAWTFTLDGHDFFVLKLGTGRKTLVYDLSTGQWSHWSSNSQEHWRASEGMNWVSSGSNPNDYGSNVVVGDDSYGLLWILDPEYGIDQGLLSSLDDVTFPRVATGQATAKSRQFIPVYNVTLEASRGQPALTANTVTLSYSDDQGNSYVTADQDITVVAGDYAQEYRWLSLGHMKAPGRLFKIEDNGAFARIDALDVNE
jgi:hypothetical protein